MKQKPSVLFSFIFMIVLLLCSFGTAAASYRVLILPFEIYADRDLSFLQKGVQDMLSTRLTLKDKMVLVSQENTRQILSTLSSPIDEKTAVSLGSRIKADYVVIGSLTVFGQSISTDARFMDVRQKRPLVVFNQAGESHGDLIQHVDQFARQVSETLFGAKTKPSFQPAPTRETEDTRMHPEKLWTGGMRVDEGGYEDGTQGRARIASALWKSRSFKSQIKGIAIGDVDGDNQNETVFISEKKVFIHRSEKGRFRRIQEIEGEGLDNFLGIDVADINKNGIAEIFITNLFDNKRLQSFVLEWNGKNYSRIADDENWYYRVLEIPNRGIRLFGQRRGISKSDVFRSGVYELIWENNQYTIGEKQPLPRETMVYGFAYGDVFNDGQEQVFVYTPTDHIRILSKSGKEEWESSEPLGGGSVYIEFPDEQFHQEESDRIYLPQRIHVADMDADGKNEVVVANNFDSSRRIFHRIRTYAKGYVECLFWDNVGLYPKWRTRKISGHVSDVAINDFDNDGKDEIVFSVVSKGGIFSYSEKSYIVSWEVGS